MDFFIYIILIVYEDNHLSHTNVINYAILNIVISSVKSTLM